MKKIRNMLETGLPAALVVVLLSSCATKNGTLQQTVNPDIPVQKNEKVAVVPEPDVAFLSGKVVETMDATGYTYILLEKDAKQAWFAVPHTEVTVGQEIEILPGMQMGTFTSKSLKKTFDKIVFAAGLVGATNAIPAPVAPEAASDQDAVPAGHPALNADPRAFEGKATKAQLLKAGIEVISGKIEETMNAGGYTYILIASGDKKIWGAVPTTEVAVGQEVQLLPGQTMTNFTSKSLNRSFESLIFSTGVVAVTK
jgi:hypothetical protein